MFYPSSERDEQFAGVQSVCHGQFVIDLTGKFRKLVDDARSSWQSMPVRTNRARLDVASIGTTAMSEIDSTLSRRHEQRHVMEEGFHE